MNERIRELAEQAGAYVNEVYTPPVRSKTPGKIWEDGHIGWHEQFHKKFAELIVRECAQAAAQTPCPYEDEFAKQTYGHTWDMACVESAKTIKKHFGVEE